MLILIYIIHIDTLLLLFKLILILVWLPKVIERGFTILLQQVTCGAVEHPEATMCKANAPARRTCKLDRQLFEAIDKRSALVIDSNPNEQLPEKEFKVKLCHNFNVCVCDGIRKDAVWCHSNIVQLFKHVFWKKRKSEERSLPRKLLEDGLVLIEIKSFPWKEAGVDNLPSKGQDSDTDSWDEMLAEETPSVGSTEIKKRYFFYIGQINFKTWHITLLEMSKESPPLSIEATTDNAESVIYLRPSTNEQPRCGLFTDMELLANVLNLEQSWSIHFLGFSAKESHWPSRGPMGQHSADMPVVPLPIEIQDQSFVFWKGSKQEAERRRIASQQKVRPKRAAGQQSGRSKSKKARKDKTAFPSDGQVHEPVPIDDDIADSDPDIADVAEGFDDDADYEEDEDQDGNEGHDSIEDDNIELIEQQLEVENVDETNSLSSELDRVHDELLEEELHQSDTVACEVSAVIPVDAVGDGDDAKQPRVRGEGVRGGVESRDVFYLPDNLGSLRYYHSSGSMVAFCGRGLHSSNCKRSGTCVPMTRSKGRPIGLLVSWLQMAHQFADKTEHVHTCRPSLQQRQDARRFFMSLDNAADFAAFEMGRGPGEPEEPLK